MTFLESHFSEILSFIGGFIAGGITVRFGSHRLSGHSKIQNFKGAQAGKDIVGGNKTETK